VAYFTRRDGVEKPGRVIVAMKQPNNPQTKFTLFFLNFILPAMNDFSKFFWADEKCITYFPRWHVS